MNYQTYVSVLCGRQSMDCPYIPQNMNNVANDWQHDIQQIDRTLLGTDPYTCCLYKL